jgi:hypothetical protein
MRIRDRVYWIGSGLLGMNSTDEWDCNIYLLDGGSEQAIIDCGSGYGLTFYHERCSLHTFNTCAYGSRWRGGSHAEAYRR